MFLKNIVNAVNGKLLNTLDENIEIKNISTDSRNIGENTLFVPIVGERVDGHNFIKSAFEKGAVCAFTEKEENITEVPLIKVKNTVKALGDLAKYYRKSLDVKVVGVTGSVGKTTTKDMVASVLSQKYNVLKTEGNYNNEIGMPLTVFNMDKNTEVAVLELGMSEFREIDYLSAIAKPDIAVITNIGTSHIENLGSREGILKAKTEMLPYIQEKGIVILNADDDMLITLDTEKYNIIWYGIENKCGIYADNIQLLGLEGSKCDIHTGKEILSVYIPVSGKHMIYNAMAAVAAGKQLGLDNEQIVKGICEFIPTKMRMNIINCENGITIINDAYNASPQSMKAAIDVLTGSACIRKVAILGDMYEMGDFAPKYHKEVGEYAAKADIDVIIAVGEISENIKSGAEEAGAKKVLYFRKQEDIKLQEILKKGDIVLVKASRGMHLEDTIDKIEKVEL